MNWNCSCYLPNPRWPTVRHCWQLMSRWSCFFYANTHLHIYTQAHYVPIAKNIAFKTFFLRFFSPYFTFSLFIAASLHFTHFSYEILTFSTLLQLSHTFFTMTHYIHPYICIYFTPVLIILITYHFLCTSLHNRIATAHPITARHPITSNDGALLRRQSSSSLPKNLRITDHTANI